MSVSDNSSSDYIYSSDMVGGIRSRTGLLVLASCATVAFAFGLSFYYALVSSQTAVARQFPELETIVSKLKSMLVMNTFGFAAVIVLSFWALSRLVSSRNFSPLGRVMKGVRKIAENRIPTPSDCDRSGPFSDFESSFVLMVDNLRSNESGEIRELAYVLESLPASTDPSVREKIERMIAIKRSRLGEARHPDAADPVPGRDKDVFMQPV